MRVLRSVALSSALLFILGAGGVHPASGEWETVGTLSGDSPPSVLIAEFYPCAVSGDEYIALCNRGPEAVNLQDWVVTDGEGSLRFLWAVLPPSSWLSISENGTSFASAYGRPPDIEVPGWSSGEGVEVSGTFRLADSGDVLQLQSPDGVVSDVVAYGDVPVPANGWSGAPLPALRQGEVVRRPPSVQAGDTDTAGDWTHFREHRYGYSDHGVEASTVIAGGVTCFVSPDCSLDVVTDLLSRADTLVQLCAYELSSSTVCAGLAEARSKGVEVRVLVDSLPVGGMSKSELACLSWLAGSGVDVRVVGGSLERGTVKHVGAMHAKYMIVDGVSLMVMSENFVEDGVPVDRLHGNRGWGVVIDDGYTASFVSRVFDDDSRLSRQDVWSWPCDPRCDPGAALPEAAESVHTSGVIQPLRSSSEADVAIFVSPDASVDLPFLVPLISGAGEMAFEQLQADLMWATRWSVEPIVNPVLEGVAASMSLGCRARGLFDGTWYNIDDNAAAAEFLSDSAQASQSQSSFGLMPDESPVTTLHNKGLALDGASIVSSNNWVYASFARNRELAVMVRSQDAYSYFLRAFDFDWCPDTTPPVADAGPDVVLPCPGDVALDASGSWDDRAIAAVSWDFDSDGRPDTYGVTAVFSPPVNGSYIVRLEVVDSWGNTAADSILVTVGTGRLPGGPIGEPAPELPWMLPAAASAIAVALAAARKLNLLRASTRGKG